tara:strand:+ start:384 stop:587 length:204 start_codon:yes stop_codon:yes gene_type:complete
MSKLLGVYMLDEISFIRLLYLFKLGIIHPENCPGKVTGFVIGIWRFEIQLILGFWEKGKAITEVGNC